ncbi:MAG: ABC-three component system protein [Sphaerochaetaceae bacterium]
MFDSVLEEDTSEANCFVSKSVASKLMNNKANVNDEIRMLLQDKRIRDKLPMYFKSKVVPKLLPLLIPDIIHELETIALNDSDISSTWKEDFHQLANENTVAEFLSDLFAYTASRQNQFNADDGNPENDMQYVPCLPIPEEVEAQELPYVTALMDVYREASEKDDLESDDLGQFPDYKSDFDRNRKRFWSAESVKRRYRDILGPQDPDQFDVLEDEVYFGIVDAYESPYEKPSGLNRLRHVMKQVAILPVTKCRLWHEKHWVGNQEKQGVCHMLVNENKLNGWRK